MGVSNFRKNVNLQGRLFAVSARRYLGEGDLDLQVSGLDLARNPAIPVTLGWITLTPDYSAGAVETREKGASITILPVSLVNSRSLHCSRSFSGLQQSATLAEFAASSTRNLLS